MPKGLREEEKMHTPTPWGYCYDGSSDWSIGEASDPQGKMVCTIWDKNDDRAKANAAFIVLAVNNHDSLLIRLKSLRKAVSKYLAESVANDIDAVIAKAESSPGPGGRG